MGDEILLSQNEHVIVFRSIKLTAPIVWHSSCSLQEGMDSVLDEEDIDEVEEDDRERFADVLCCIGTLARMIPHHSIPLLSK